jgi:hypothetical protein
MYVLTGKFLLLLLYIGCATNQWISPLPAGSGMFGSYSVFCGDSLVYTWYAEGVGYKGSGDTTRVNVETILEAFLENFQRWDCSPQMLKCQDFQSIGIWIKGILLCACVHACCTYCGHVHQHARIVYALHWQGYRLDGSTRFFVFLSHPDHICLSNPLILL